MPMRPLKPCRFPGCAELCSGRFCSMHESVEMTHITSRKQTNAALMMADEFYTSRRWRGMRAAQLRREPFCRACSSGLNPVLASEVDHILPINQGGQKLSFGNLQSLCKACHDRKRQQESLAAR